MVAIGASGFAGYVAQVFIPKERDNIGLDSLADAIRRCDV